LANSATRIYGDPDPELTFAVDGLLDGDTTESVFEKVEEPMLYVLEESGWLYINTEGWSKFSTYIKK
jgi:hypothetical protein